MEWDFADVPTFLSVDVPCAPRNFIPGGAMGVRLQSNPPFNWASADNLGFIRDLSRRFKVCVVCGSRRHQRCREEIGSTPLSLASKWHSQVSIAFSAWLVKWSFCGNIWKSTLFAVKKVFRASGYSLSMGREEGLMPRPSRYWISRVCALTNSGVAFF